MKGISILTHAIGMVVNNLDTALRISAVLMAVQFVLAIVLGVQFVYLGDDMSHQMMSGGYPWGGAFVIWLVQALSALWIAVAWHRFILTEERPAGFMPVFNGGALGAYFIAGVIFFLVILVVAIPVGIVAGLLSAPFMMGGTPGMVLGGLILFFLVWIPVAYVSYRISPILPSAALQNRIALREAWYATGTSGASFVVLAVASMVLLWAVNLPAGWLAALSPFLGFVWAFVVQWASLLVGVSILTTIYGHYVEKRVIDA
ncbi:MAG: hypothetical protein ACK4LQ_05510 [Pararhodobacter sp.]